MVDYRSIPLSQMKKASVGCLPLLGLLLLATCVAGLLVWFTIFLRFQAVNQYEQGSCTILSSDIIEHDSHDKSGHVTSRSWAATFGYTVLTKNGQRIDTSGYDFPPNDLPTWDDANSVVESHPTGSSFTCWYSPKKPEHAFLILHNQSLQEFAHADNSLLIGGWIGGSLLLLALFSALFYGIYRSTMLRLRGVMTQGYIHSTYQVKTKSGLQTRSRVVFAPINNPLEWYTYDIAGQRPIGEVRPICYDPHHPASKREGGPPSPATITTYSFLSFLLLWAIVGAIWLLVNAAV